ncbi:uncharacterized protein B0H18DRAFT_975090 [Fomitopsis serialis]|uniref:uncharacterized protein n=1 Tax=Fomitopsis serialis TaxID=139415 RepID=UPI002008A269|nr:uncharacterized protein B0H18DRAFT_975090 [Neoantrodia serialis]KAH9935279.1 hypothetical protein B0H18DRAFT_975090 [Neoantrodia serialis]
MSRHSHVFLGPRYSVLINKETLTTARSEGLKERLAVSTATSYPPELPRQCIRRCRSPIVLPESSS